MVDIDARGVYGFTLSKVNGSTMALGNVAYSTLDIKTDYGLMEHLGTGSSVATAATPPSTSPLEFRGSWMAAPDAAASLGAVRGCYAGFEEGFCWHGFCW